MAVKITHVMADGRIVDDISKVKIPENSGVYEVLASILRKQNQTKIDAKADDLKEGA